MKTSLLATMVMAFAASAFAADAPKMDPQMAEMMQKFQAYATPGPQHKMLADMAGKWTYTSKMWMQAGAKPEESKGTSTFKMIMGGRWLQHETKGKAMGQSFEGMGLTGFDNLKGKFQTMWIDNMGTGMMTGEGSFDAASKTLTDTGTFSCPMSDSKTRSYRAEWKMMDKNHMTYSMSGPGPKGEPEFKQMEMVFKRAM